uniref:Elongation of very long chain fatty acids protein n=1 Tax=Gasterosteus aculeatus aculeatus TaxID=481459 RepID=A0AAQ4S0P1_GASAC
MSVLALQEYEFERQFNEDEAIRWMKDNWKKSFLFAALYVAFILGGRHVMKQREKFELRKPLVLWSLTLALFSIFGAIRTGSFMVHILMTKGLKQSVCDQSFYNGPISKFWAYAFVLSKAPELGKLRPPTASEAAAVEPSSPNNSPCRSCRRHALHRPEETEAHLPPLVPPHHRAALLLVLLQRHGGRRRMVHDHELPGPRRHVLLLRPAGGRLQGVAQVRHVHHADPDHPDADGLRGQLPGVLVDAAGPRVPIPHAEHCVVLPHVPQLLCALCPVLLRGLLCSEVQFEGLGRRQEERVDEGGGAGP